ncbi:hypothetical protein RDABS01_019856, partial [Bienertia sinuspersici]
MGIVKRVRLTRERSSTEMLLYNDMPRKRSVSEASQFFRTAMENADSIARESTYELLIRGLCDKGLTEEVLKLQAQMAGNGFRPYLYT